MGAGSVDRESRFAIFLARILWKMRLALAKISLRFSRVSRGGKNAIYCESCTSPICETHNFHDSQTNSEKLAIFVHNSVLWPIARNELKVEYLGKIEAIFKTALCNESRDQVGSICEKTEG